MSGTRLRSRNTAEGLSASSSKDSATATGGRHAVSHARAKTQPRWSRRRRAFPTVPRHLDRAPHHPQAVRADGVQQSGEVEHAKQPAVAGSMMGVSVQAHSCWLRTRCSAENSCTGWPVSASLALVPLPASDQSAP